MAGYVLHVGATVQCPHQAPAQVTPANAGVRVSGQAVAVLTDKHLVSGCPFVNSGVASACIDVQWVKAATRVKVHGQFVLIADSNGLCLGPSGTQGTPSVKTTQSRVKAT